MPLELPVRPIHPAGRLDTDRNTNLTFMFDPWEIMAQDINTEAWINIHDGL